MLRRYHESCGTVSPVNTSGMSVETMKGLLRAYGLPVGGRRDELTTRLARLDVLRGRYHGDRQALEAHTVPELKAMLDGLWVKAWKMPRKSQLVQSLVRLTGMPEPSPKEPASTSSKGWFVVWFNPATLQREVHTGGLSHAAARRLEGVVEGRLQNSFVSLGPHLKEFSQFGEHREPSVWTTQRPDAFDPAGTPAEEAAAEALYKIVNLERSCMAPAMSGDTGTCRAIARQIEKAKADLEDARRRVLDERGLV